MNVEGTLIMNTTTDIKYCVYGLGVMCEGRVRCCVLGKREDSLNVVCQCGWKDLLRVVGWVFLSAKNTALDEPI